MGRIIFLIIYLFLIALSLCYYKQAFSSCGERGPRFSCGAWASYCCDFLMWRSSRHAGFRTCVLHGLSCSAACGIFLDQGSNLCPLQWQADSYLLHYEGSPGRENSRRNGCLMHQPSMGLSHGGIVRACPQCGTVPSHLPHVGRAVSGAAGA